MAKQALEIAIPTARPKPRPISPGTIADRSPDSDEGFNVGKNRRRSAIRNERRADRLAALDSRPPVAEAPMTSPNHLAQADSSQQEDIDSAPSGEEIEGQDSDWDRRILNRVVQLGLDPNDGVIRELLRDGRRTNGGIENEDGGDELSSERGREESSPPPESEQEDDPDGSPPPQFEFNFNKWTRYSAHSLDTGTQTAVDRLTRYRAIGATTWLLIPPGQRAPRLDDPFQEEEAALHEKDCLEAGIHPDHHFGAVLPSRRAVEEAARKEEVGRKEQSRRDEPPKKEHPRIEAARKEEVAKKSGGLSRQQIQHNLYKLGMAQKQTRDQQTPTESDLSGSDYSETERDARRKKGHEEEEEEEETSSGGGEESPCGPKSKGKAVDSLPLKAKGKGRAARSKGKDNAPAHATKDKGKAPVTSTRPSTEQREKVKALRLEIEERVASLAVELDAKPEVVLKQLRLGGITDMRKASLVNLYSQVFSLNGGGEGLGCMYSLYNSCPINKLTYILGLY
jgi:hypothetical protein